MSLIFTDDQIIHKKAKAIDGNHTLLSMENSRWMAQLHIPKTGLLTNDRYLGTIFYLPTLASNSAMDTTRCIHFPGVQSIYDMGKCRSCVEVSCHTQYRGNTTFNTAWPQLDTLLLPHLILKWATDMWLRLLMRLWLQINKASSGIHIVHS